MIDDRDVVKNKTIIYCLYLILYHKQMGFPNGSDSKQSACNAGDLGLIPGLVRSPGGGHTPVFLPGESPWIEVPVTV